MSFKKIILIIIIGLFVVVSFYLVYAAGSKNWPFRIKYQVVVLKSGDIYFGKLSLFPRPKMIDVWLLQQTQDQGQPRLQILPLSSMYFGPENILYLERDNISWWSNLREDSEVVKIMRDRSRIQPQTQMPETESLPPQTTE